MLWNLNKYEYKNVIEWIKNKLWLLEDWMIKATLQY